MRIALSGSSCTGKTTLMKEIEKDPYFKDFHLFEEVVRSLKKSGQISAVNKKISFQDQKTILTTHHRNVLSRDNFITDRGVLDAFVYATYDYLEGHYNFEEWKLFESIFLTTIKEYSYIFYLSTEIPLIKDGFRSEDLLYRKEIEKLFLRVIDVYRLPTVRELKGSVEDRLNSLRKIVFYI